MVSMSMSQTVITIMMDFIHINPEMRMKMLKICEFSKGEKGNVRYVLCGRQVACGSFMDLIAFPGSAFIQKGRVSVSTWD